MLNLIKSYWINVNKPGSFAGVEKLYKALQNDGHKISRKRVSDFLKNQFTYQLHYPARKRFIRRSIIVSAPNLLWDADLLDLSKFQNFNFRNRYLLIAIDVFSRKAYAQAITTKTANAVAEAFQKIIRENDNMKPMKLRTDHGGEFKGSFDKLLKELNIEHILTSSPEIKANYVERFHRTFRDKLGKRMTYFSDKNWTKVYKMLIDSYNNTPHRSLKYIAPNNVNSSNIGALLNSMLEEERQKFLKQKSTNTEFSIGDLVRISIFKKGVFGKASEETYTDELFRIISIIPGNPKMYKIEDMDDPPETVIGSFYGKELEKAEENSLQHKRIRKATEQKMPQHTYKVQFQNLPSKFDRIVSKKELQMYRTPK